MERPRIKGCRREDGSRIRSQCRLRRSGQELSRWNLSAVATTDGAAQPLTRSWDEPLGGALSDTQTFEEGPRPDQIGGSEALCKSVVHGLQ